MSEQTLTIQDLLDAGLHFGHQTKRWNPKMKRFIHGAKGGIYIIDLQKTLVHLKMAQEFLNDTVMNGRKVLFVGTKKQARDIFKGAAENASQPYVVNRWLGGMLTNSQTVRLSVKRMEELQAFFADEAQLKEISKKEQSML
ncbi:MAG TPA: 30S ribosomal protein S2, partial [Tichowtungia sp.]|nr:30S ribosomal protein S2 [Tichowtungia sp.]